MAYALPVVDANATAYGGPEIFCACHAPQDWAIVKCWDDRPVVHAVARTWRLLAAPSVRSRPPLRDASER